jgi:serine/threonine protein kinase
MNVDDKLPPDTYVDGFVVRSLIGQGGFGQIYTVEEINTHRLCAMKIEYFDSIKHGMLEEIAIFKELGDSPLFPFFIADGETERYRYFVMELVGPSILSIREALESNQYSTYTLLHIAYHGMRTIEAFHARGFVHRDIKPSNFLIRTDRRNPIVLIDFGLSRSYRGPNGEHLAPRASPGYTGTVKFASLHAHDRMELSRRDDLISWFYTMIACAAGDTPWPGRDNKRKAIEMKRALSVKRLCASLPAEFAQIWTLIKSLEYADEPDYERIRRLIVQAIVRLRPAGDAYDWERLEASVIRELTPLSLDMGDPLGSDSLGRAADDDRESAGGGCGCSVY